MNSILNAAPVHPGGLTASQSLAFFRANSILGRLIRATRAGREVREYQCLSVHLGGTVATATHRILAPRANHNTGA